MTFYLPLVLPPDIFDEEQLYIVFEFADGGQDLEGFEVGIVV